MDRSRTGTNRTHGQKRSQSGWALTEIVAVLAIVSIMIGYGVHSWQERRQRAELSGDLASVQDLAYRLDRRYCARTSTMQMTLAAARTDLGLDIAVQDDTRWRIHLELPTTGTPGMADRYFLHRRPTLIVYRTPRTSWEGSHLLGRAGASARFVTAGGSTFDTVQIPVMQEEGRKGSQREFQFLMRDDASLDSRC